MKPRWEDLATRARGLTAHLLGRADLDRLARAQTLDAVGETLRGRGVLVPEGPTTAEQLELAVRRAAGALLQIIARWAGARSAVLAVVFADEDRRSVRALLRGAVQHAPPQERLAGVIPTPELPERALAELAAQPGVAAIATLLTAWHHEYGPPLLEATRAAEPDLLTLEYRLSRAFAGRALRGACSARDRTLLTYVRRTIDLENAAAALALAEAEPETAAPEAFLAGGERLSLATFRAAAATHDTVAAGAMLAAAFAPSPLAALFRRSDPVQLERALLQHRIAEQQALARRDPAGAASVLAFALRLRAQVLDLDRVIWGLALDAPRAEIAAALVSA